MAEDISIDKSLGKEEKYQALIPQLKALVTGEDNLVANMANLTAALNMAFDFFWVGFYLVEKDELVLGPFQGPVACTRLTFGKGVCGTAWKEKQSIVVPDVEKFPGHIACNSASRSEIVVPGFNTTGDVVFVLDVDSDRLNDFDDIDRKYLEEIVKLIGFCP